MSNHFETLARFGYAARGLVYLLLGGLALSSAIYGGEGETTDSRGALSTILSLPFGRILMSAVVIGLIGYVLWRLAQGIFDADDAGTDAKGLVGRAGSILSGVVNAALALTAAKMALSIDTGAGGGQGGEEGLSAWLISQPFGPWLLGLTGLGVIVAGFVQMWRGWSRDYEKHMPLPAAHKAFLDPVCRFGLIARGVVFAIIGGFFAYAAFTVSPEQAGGVNDALDYVHNLPFGRWLYGLAALGLVAFGGYGIIQALYRHVDAPDPRRLADAIPGPH